MASHFNEIDSYEMSPEYRPLGAWAYFGWSILFSLPVIGLILLIVMSFSESNINRRNYARSYFCAFLIMLIIIGVMFFTGTLTETIEAIAAGRWPNYLDFLPWA